MIEWLIRAFGRDRDAQPVATHAIDEIPLSDPAEKEEARSRIQGAAERVQRLEIQARVLERRAEVEGS